eukprot:2918582-Rhodomonas_salina.4
MDWKRKAHALALELEVTEGRLYLATEANKTRMHDMMLLKSFVMERMGCALSELNSMHGDVLQIATSTVRASFLHDDWEITHHTIVDEARDKDEEMTNLRKQVEVTSRQLSMEMERAAEAEANAAAVRLENNLLQQKMEEVVQDRDCLFIQASQSEVSGERQRQAGPEANAETETEAETEAETNVETERKGLSPRGAAVCGLARAADRGALSGSAQADAALKLERELSDAERMWKSAVEEAQQVSADASLRQHV